MEQARQEHSAADTRMEEIRERVTKLADEAPKYDDVLVRKAVETIRVKSAEQVEITFRDGRTVKAKVGKTK